MQYAAKNFSLADTSGHVQCTEPLTFLVTVKHLSIATRTQYDKRSATLVLVHRAEYDKRSVTLVLVHRAVVISRAMTMMVTL